MTSDTPVLGDRFAAAFSLAFSLHSLTTVDEILANEVVVFKDRIRLDVQARPDEFLRTSQESRRSLPLSTE